MRVLLISEVMWPYGGGGELATYLWLRILSPVLKITVATAKIDKRSIDELKGLGIDTVQMSSIDTSSRTKLWISLERAKGYIKNLLQGYDLVWIPRLCYPVITISRQLAKPVIVHLHDYVSVDPSGAVVSPRYGYSMLRLLGLRNYVRRMLVSPLWRKVIAYLDQATMTVFVSNRQKDIICSKRPTLCRSYSVLPNPLPRITTGALTTETLDRVLGIISNHEYILFGGGLSKLKGFDIVKKLARIFAKHGILTVVSKARRLYFDKEARIVYVPRLSYSEYIKLLGSAKAFLYPSIYEEPLPYAVIEALLVGVPPVVTYVGGIPEILGRRYPMYVTDTSWNTLNAIANKLIKNYDDISEHIKNRAEILRNTWRDNKLRDSFITMIKRIIGRDGDSNHL